MYLNDAIKTIEMTLRSTCMMLEVVRNEQIDKAVKQAQSEGKFVICQVGGNWCPWCLRFAEFITSDSTINKLVNDNFVYIHVNYNPRQSDPAQKELAAKMMKRLGNRKKPCLLQRTLLTLIQVLALVLKNTHTKTLFRCPCNYYMLPVREM